MKTQKILVLLVLGLLAVGARAQSLKFISVGPGFYSRFNGSGQVNPTEQYDYFTPTNVPAVTCTLESRSFPGTTPDSSGKYGYEYSVTLNNSGSTDTNIVTVDSLTLKFGEPDFFSFGFSASNQVWVLNPGASPLSAPGSADLADDKVTLHFSPPLTLSTLTDQSTNTFYFGLMSGGAPKITTAILSGSTQDPTNGIVPFKAKLQAQTP